MSTLPVLASKGEKEKAAKYQSLDINKLYRVTLGENLENKQQKSTLSQKHGMQSLGKVPSTRRPPANLPSLKSEHSGTDTAVSLVPSNGSGWGNKESTVPTSTTTTTQQTANNVNANAPPAAGTPQLTAHQAAIALPVTTTIQQPANKTHPTSATPATNLDKSWSSVMIGSDPNAAHPPPYQSPQFQHEFPSLSAGDGAPPRAATDIQYAPGLSLRPQTEGSWLQGGSRGGAPADGGGALAAAGARANSAAPAGPPPHSGPAGQPLPPQVRGFVPNFMYRGSGYPTNGVGGPPPGPMMQPPASAMGGPQRRGDPRHRQQNAEVEELATRPIIKEEDLSGMDNLTGDMGWAINDDIDYNQKLAFSDDELKADNESRKIQVSRTNKDYDKTDTHLQEADIKPSWNTSNNNSSGNINSSGHNHNSGGLNLNPGGPILISGGHNLNSGGHNLNSGGHNLNSGGHNNANPKNAPRVGGGGGRHEEDEYSVQRRRHQQEVANAVERAKQRKEEEEKKFLETRQAAKKKLQELDERLGKSKRDKDVDDHCGTINPDAVPPQTIAPVPILLPEWEREKEVRVSKPLPAAAQHHHDASDDGGTHKPAHRDTDFKHLTQIEGRATFNRKDSRSVEKEPAPAAPPGGNTGAPFSNFSKQFQINLPPRFQKQQQLNAQSAFQYENRWSQGGNRTSPSNRKGREDEKEAEDRYGGRRSEESYRSHRPYGESGRKSSDSRYEEHGKDRDYDFKPKEEEKIRERVRDRHEKVDTFDGVTISRQSSDEWHGDKRTEKYDRPQRPDSRDSRTSRESRHSGDSTRHSETRGWYSSWAEDPIEEKKKDHHRMVVPPPITKDKIEADDLRGEKRSLTQLKRGALTDKRTDKGDTDDDSWSIMKKDSIDEPKAWADSIPLAVEKEMLKAKEEKRDEEDEKKEKSMDKDDKKHQGGRGRSDSQGSRNQGWSGSGQVYRSSWSSNNTKKNPAPPPSSRGPRGGTRTLSKGHDMTESEGSADDATLPMENAPSPQPSKKLEKDERNKETRSAEKQQPLGDRSKMDKNHFIPRGEPSRHGRGGSIAGSFRGSRGGSKRIDTYGPPAKSPFSNIDEKDQRRHDDSEDEHRSQLKDAKLDDKNRKKPDARKTRPKQDGDVSDNSDMDGRKSKNSQRSTQSGGSRRGAPNSAAPPRQISAGGDKRGFGGPRSDQPPPAHRQPTTGVPQRAMGAPGLKDKEFKEKDANALSSAIADISLKDVEHMDGSELVIEDGFQEVKSKKTERKVEKPKEEKPKVFVKPPEKKDLNKPERNPKGIVNQILPPTANIPSLMATPVNPPPNMPPSQVNKGQFDRNRQNKTIPPRFAKAKEQNRMQKAQMQQGMCDDLSKVNPNLYGLKEGLHAVSTSMNSNAWDKPLSAQLRVDQDLVVAGMEACKNLESTLHHPNVSDDKAVLDGSKPLNTIIFENTNYKSAPGSRGRNDKPRCNKMDEGMDLTNFNKPIGELLGKDKSADLQMQLFNKEDSADMKLDFLESEISQITEDKGSKMSLSRSNMATGNILTADALNMKIQSVKKVWDSSIPNMMEHADDSFVSSFVPDPNAMDAQTAFSKGSEVVDDGHDVYASANAANSNSTTNVCKVKPTQQVAGAGGQAILSAGGHQPHSNLVGPAALMGHALSSPPPIQPVMGGLGQPPQQYTASQHISYQPAGLGSNQYGGIPAPSPPTVLNYSTPQLQQTGLYAPFQIDQQVMNSQGRSQYSQYSFGLGQNGSSPYSQSVYLQGQHAPPPNPQQDLYQNMNSYRLPNTGPFGQNQQLNNPTTVLISSTSNSLMSPSVKPSNQQISAIGTKAGGVGQAYQQQSQQGQQVYIPFDPSITANYMQSAGVLRGPGGPVQNSVGLQQSGLQPSSSFYSGSTGGQTGYFPGPGSSNLQSQMPQHQTGFGLQQSVFPTHNQSHTNAGMQNFPAPYLSGQMQLAAAAMSQYRSANMQSSQYMKSQMGDQGRQQLKSPGSQQEVLSSVFNSGSQIASPKSRQQMKQPPPQPSPTAQHNKYLYANMSNQQGGQTRYPTPIQRPAGNYQSQMSNVQNSGNQNQKPHRMNNSNNRSSGGRQYYGPQGGNMNTQPDKAEESKLNDNVNSSNQSSTGSSANMGAKSSAALNQSGDKTDAKEENCAKD